MDPQQRWYQQNIRMAGQIVADVGANVGALSEFFVKQVGRSGKVVSVEPLPSNIKQIQARMKRVKAKRRWTLKKCAVSSTEGHVTMRRVGASWGDNGMVIDGAESGLDVMKVPCLPLAALVPNATLVKLDIEGHEYAVLPQAIDSLPAVRCWALELHGVPGSSLADTLALFEQAGFGLVGAGQRVGSDADWVNVAISSKLSWQQIPGTPSICDGVPGLFKMLHVIARRA